MSDKDVLCEGCFREKKDKIFPLKTSFNVSFTNQSVLAIVMGIITIIGSFGIFSIPMGSGAMGGITAFIVWILFVLFGIALIKLGTRKVPDYDEFFASIERFVNHAVNEARKKDEPKSALE